jgi:hypothetical protein
MIHFFFTGQLQQKRRLEQFGHDVLNHLCKDIDHDVDIEIRSEKHLDGAMGYCSGDNESIIIELARGTNIGYEYERYDFDEVVVTFAHELVHAKQLIEGCTFESRKSHKGRDQREVEAYGLEYKLVRRYWNPN